MDPDMEELPTDYAGGVDFRLTKSSKGGYADYSTSNWARRDRPLSDDEQASVTTNGLWNLSDFLPKKPSDIEVKVLTEMFEASVDGEPYDPDRWSQYFRPAGMAQRTGDPKSSPAKPAVTPAVTPASTKTDDIPFKSNEEVAKESSDNPAPAENTGGAQDILAMIRSRQNT